MRLPPLPDTDADAADSWYYTVDQMVAIRREAFIAGLEEAEKVCIEQSTAADKRWRGDAYDDGSCDMAAALAADILKLKEKIE